MLVTRGGDKHAEVAFWQAFEDADTFGSLIRPNQDLIAPLTAHVESLGEAETLFGGEVLDRARTVLDSRCISRPGTTWSSPTRPTWAPATWEPSWRSSRNANTRIRRQTSLRCFSSGAGV